MATSAPANDRMNKRIKAALPSVSGFEADKLAYVAKQITPAGLLKRGEEDQDVTHLHEIAERILRDHEKETLTDD